MKLSLDSLNKEDTGSNLTIDSLKGQETLPLGNDLSNTNRAAFASMAVGGDVVSNYQFFKDSLDINADDQPVKQSLQKVEQARQQRIRITSYNVCYTKLLRSSISLQRLQRLSEKTSAEEAIV